LPNPNDARGQIGRVHYDSDRQREFRRTFERARFGANKGSRLERSYRRRQTAAACAIRERHHTGQVVMQGTTLIIRIIAAMFVLSTIVMGVVMVHVRDPAGLGQVGRDILVILEGMLDMGADQRHDTGSLGQQKEPQEHRTKTP
jgi:hypothetical protein